MENNTSILKDISMGGIDKEKMEDFANKNNLEIKKIGININDNSLRAIIKNDKLFLKDGKFSRTKYEKFLLTSNLTAPAFEANIKQQESRRQLLSSLAGGIVVPDILVKNTFKKENQIKTIRYIDLKKYHLSNKPTETKIKELYERNKQIFIEEFKTIEYAEITPQALTSNTDYDEAFFKQLDTIENNVLDGQSFDSVIKENNLNLIEINKINSKKKDENRKEFKNFSDNLFKKFYIIKNENMPEVIKVNNKYFLAQIKLIEKISKPMNDLDVLKSLNSQLNFQAKIENNTSLLKDISMGGFDKEKMEDFANKNNLEIKNYKISDLNQNEIFSNGIIKRIFLTKDNEINLITNSTLTKNFLILTLDTEFKKIEKKSNEFEKYEAKARLDLINKIYKNFDDQLNLKYKVVLNQRTIKRVKNSF